MAGAQTTDMINLQFSLHNSFSKRKWESLLERGGNISKNKAWEIQVCRDSSLFSVSFNLTFRQSHAGLFIGLGLFGYDVLVNIYDVRHWDHDKDCWMK